jgi:hypothetical protein
VEVDSEAKTEIEALLEAAWNVTPSSELRARLHKLVPGYMPEQTDAEVVTAGEARVTPLWNPKMPTPASIPVEELAATTASVFHKDGTRKDGSRRAYGVHPR